MATAAPPDRTRNAVGSASPATASAGSSRDRLSVRGLICVFVVLGLGPLGLLTYCSVHLSGKAVVHEVNARVRTTAGVSALLVQQEMQGVAELTTSYAGRYRLFHALADGARSQFDASMIDRQLQGLAQARPGIAVASVADTRCRIAEAEPANPALIGKSFSYRDWCRGVTATGGPYVSSAYRTAFAGHPLVVAVATMVRSGGLADGRPLGILFVVYRLATIQRFAGELAQAQAIHLLITDQRGTMLAGDTGKTAVSLVSVAADNRVRAALAGRSGQLRSHTTYGDTLSAYSPVPKIGWTVTAQAPASVALAGVRRLRSTVLIVAGLLGLVLLGGLLLTARMLVLRRRATRTLTEREASTRSILDAGTDAFVSVDADGAISTWSRQAEEIFGWTEADVLGRKLSETILVANRRTAFDEGLAGFLATGDESVVNQRVEVVALHREGHELPVELAIWPVRSHDEWSFSAFVRDITERKQAESELAAARDQALENSRLKSEFLANMSHEIRTPLNGVLGMTSLLLDTKLHGEQREFAETVRASGEALLVLLNDILDFSKIEAGHLDLESIDFDLRALLEDVVGLLSLPAHHKGLELACSLPVEMPATIRGDPGRLRQIITNLIGNAVKFTASGEVLLDLSIEREDGADPILHFEVVDTGIGIAAADQEAMFDSFSQVDASTTRRFGGTGLGLAISRQLVELMGGEIGVHSELGQGSTFWFTIPLQRGQAIGADVPRDGLAGLRALVVDDNATNRAILTRFLHAWGVRSQAVDGAAEAQLALAASVSDGDPFDVVLLDLNMPDVDGFELARRIAADATLAPLQMVLLTSSGLGGEAQQAREAGIGACLTKPVRQSHLYDCLVTVTGRSGPAAPPPPAALAGSRSADSAAAGHVLLAEDNAVNQRVALGMLRSLGFRVDVVSDGAQAVRAATETTYQAILMDCQMPVLDGYEATAEIRRLQEGSPHTPIIAVTASAMKSDRQRCLDAGMDDYITKPLSVEAVAGVLARWAPDPSNPNLLGDPARPVPDPAADGAANGDIPALDAEIVERLERLGSDVGEDLMGQLTTLFLADAELRIVALREGLAARQAAAVSRCAHTLSGASANLGASVLAGLCSTLEADSAAGNLDDGVAQLQGLESELERVRSALDSRVAIG